MFIFIVIGYFWVRVCLVDGSICIRGRGEVGEWFLEDLWDWVSFWGMGVGI